MFKFLKRKNPDVTIRADELEVGDRFVYDYPVVVTAIALTPKYAVVDLDPTIPGSLPRKQTVSIHREILITVPAR
jgi:hypothetical protein